MNQINFSTSACRHCRHYEPQGRRGGDCQMLGVSVQSTWKACALAAPPFKTTLTKLEDIFQLAKPIRLNSVTKLASGNQPGVRVRKNSQQITAPKLE